jgi:quercetin dioxygenase-like cupin family protein
MSAERADGLKGMAEAQVLELAALVNYQGGSVVSRTLVARATGTVTLFAFSEGQGLSEHTAPFDALVQLLEGEAEIMVEGKVLAVKSGGAVLLPANRPHAVKAVKAFKMLLTMIRS